MNAKSKLNIIVRDKKPKKLSDDELKSHISTYWRKAAERGKNQLPNSITDKPLL